MNAPTAHDLATHPDVIKALDDAWLDSLADDPMTRHEEGGWIYFEPNRGTVTIQRAASGIATEIALADPPILAGQFIVATFHTHPNPTDQGWDPGPSPADVKSANQLGVPCLIRSDQGIHLTGPVVRRGGLSGNPGFPD